MNLKTICTNLALQYAGTSSVPSGTLATPSGATAIRSVWGQAPQAVPTLPAIVVLPLNGTTIYGDALTENEIHIDVRLYLTKATGDIGREETQRQLWLPSLLTATNQNMALDLEPTVLKAIPTGWEFVEIPYGGDLYDGVVLHITVFVREYGTFHP